MCLSSEFNSGLPRVADSRPLVKGIEDARYTFGIGNFGTRRLSSRTRAVPSNTLLTIDKNVDFMTPMINSSGLLVSRNFHQPD